MCERSPSGSLRRNAAALILLGLLAGGSAPALAQSQGPAPRAGDTVEWYVVKPGDTLIGLTTRYLGDGTLWQENHRLNPQVRDPHRLQPGARIRIITARAGARRNATVNRVSRRVEAKPEPRPWVPARPGDQLKERDGVRTYERSSADLVFDDGAHLFVTENSLLFLKQVSPSTARTPREAVEIVEGQVDVKVTPKGTKSAEVEVLVGSTSIKHTGSKAAPVSARSRRADSDRAQVMVYGGSSDVASGGRSVKVGAGMGTDVVQGQAPRTPEKLLPSPAPVSPAANAALGEGSFRWNAVPGAAAYTIEIFRDPDGARLVERRTGLPEPAWTPEAPLPLEDLYWRVTAVSSSGLDGFPSGTRRLRGSGGIAGEVVEDPVASATRETALAVPRARVLIYRDNGDGAPDDGDARAGETTTNDAGRFTFDVPAGTYWIVVDSRSVQPWAGFNEGAIPASVWATQTYGSTGSLCMSAAGAAPRSEAGPCYGGRFTDRDDAPARLSTSRHVARVVMTSEEAPPHIAFGFSFNAVTSTADLTEGEAGWQGTLRQFMVNANAIRGANAMRFFPLLPPNAGENRTSWVIRCRAPLPRLTDRQTEINGSAWNALEHGKRATAAGDPAEETADLEIVAVGDGFEVEADTRLSALALTAPQTGVVANASLTTYGLLIGAHPDGTPSAGPNVGVLANSGEILLGRTTVMGARDRGVVVGGQARLNATRLSVLLAPAAPGPAIVITSPGANVRDSEVDAGGTAKGIVLEAGSGQTRLTAVAVRRAADGIVIRGGSSDNELVENKYEDIGGAGVLLDPTGGVPLRNRVSKSEFHLVKELIGQTGGKVGTQGECGSEETAPNRGISPPLITSFEEVPRNLLALYGKACMGTSVEIYEGTLADRSTAKYLQTSAPAYDGTFALLVEQYTEQTRMFVTVIDGDGNTSQFTVSEPPQMQKKRKKKEPERKGAT